MIDWRRVPDATHFTAKPDDCGMWCDVFWKMDGDTAIEAWSIQDDGGLRHHMKPTLIEETRERMIARPAMTVDIWLEGIAQEYGQEAAAKCRAIISEAEDRKQVTK